MAQFVVGSGILTVASREFLLSPVTLDLPLCFSDGKVVRTTWLKKLLHNDTATELNLLNVVRFWGDFIKVPDARLSLLWIGEALTKAKELRNDNNYESLLIAHEFRHTGVTALFERLAAAMQILAERALQFSVKAFAQYMQGRSDDERTFIARYCEKRIVCPVVEWYGELLGTKIRDIVAPLLSVPRIDTEGANRLDEMTSRKFFNEKDGLMNEFQRKIWELEHSAT